MKNEIKTRKGMNRRQFIKRVASGAGSTVLAAPAVGLMAAPSYASSNNHLTFAIKAEPPSLDPLAIEQRIPRMVTFNIYETLVDRNDAGEIVPMLATGWEQIDPTRMRFKIRDGVKFHDGESLTAEDVAYSINRVIAPETKSQFIGIVNTIARAEIVDSSTVDIVTKKPDPILMARVYTISIMNKNWTEAIGKDVANSTNGTGPYRMTEWKRNHAIHLEHFSDHWGPVPQAKSATILIIGEDATTFQMIKTGELDCYLGLLPDHIHEAKNYRAGLAQNMSFVRLNNAPESDVHDVRIRQAMNYAVNKQVLLDALFQGQGAVLPGQVSSPQIFGFNKDLEAYPHDLDKARALIKEAGAVGKEIDFVGPKGRYTGDGLEMQAIASMIEDCGLKVNLNLRDPQSWVRIGDRNQTPVPPSAWYVRHSNFLFDADKTFSTYYTNDSPYSSYHNQEIRDIYDVQKSELNVEARRGQLEQIYAKGREDPCALFLLQHVDLWGLSEKANFEPRPDGVMQISRFTIDA